MLGRGKVRKAAETETGKQGNTDREQTQGEIEGRQNEGEKELQEKRQRHKNVETDGPGQGWWRHRA